MIDNLFDVLYVAKTGKIKPNASLSDNLYGKKFYDAHSGVITTTTGNPVSIVTNKAQNAISTILSYSPKQSGSGDPSPINIRPIEGWTEVNLGINSETPTLTISLGGTYYGFSVDVERGVLRATHVCFSIGSSDWVNVSGFSNVFRTSKTDKDSGNADLISSSYLTESVSASTADMSDYSIKGNSAQSQAYWQYIYIKDTRYSTADDFKSAEGSQMICYKLVTPIEIPLTPQIVALLAGNNTLWTDGDEITITYKAKR